MFKKHKMINYDPYNSFYIKKPHRSLFLFIFNFAFRFAVSSSRKKRHFLRRSK